MSLETAEKIINFIFLRAQKDDLIEIGFFGGEPLLEFGLIKSITDKIQRHGSYEPERVLISVTSNGTIFSQELADFLIEKNLFLDISCDGPPPIQDAHRRFGDGRGSSSIVEKNIIRALKFFPLMPVNAVYSPENLSLLPDVVAYLSSLGVRNIYLNPNISAKWTKREADKLEEVYQKVGKMYLDFYEQGMPHYISLIDSKISVLLRGGYKPFERCRMGSGEFAFGPSGNIYLCERLVGSDDGNAHCIGNINEGTKLAIKGCKMVPSAAVNKECATCGLKEYCMNGCGCMNYFSTGKYDEVAPFICASEKAAINTAYRIIQKVKGDWSSFSNLISGSPLMNEICTAVNEKDTNKAYSETKLP
jgi:uncharacterized protein